MIGAAFLLLSSVGADAVQTLLDGSLIPKFVEPLPVAGDISVVNATSIRHIAGLRAQNSRRNFPISANEFQAQILPTLANWNAVEGYEAPTTCMDEAREEPATASWAWGYLIPGDNPGQIRPSYLGPVVVAERGVPFMPLYQNRLPYFGYVQQNYQIDMTLDWANPDGIDCLKEGPGDTFPDSDVDDPFTNPVCGANVAYMGEIPIATHLHGGEVSGLYDGGPDAWFTQGFAKTGAGWPGQTYEYPNEQQESTIWFHDHGLGVTRLNVYAGLAGLYPIIDPANPPETDMPAFPQYDIPLILQDRSFDTNCELYYNLASNPQPNPSVHPRWIPEFIGDTIAVNGRTWPYLEVEPRQYRFRFVNGSNARFYNLTLDNDEDFIVIATDDGYLENAVATSSLTIGPGERYEVIVDFEDDAGENIVMENDAYTPFPDGDSIPGDGNGTDQVMQFRVNQEKSDIDDSDIQDGDRIRPVGHDIVTIKDAHDADANSITRQLTLNEVSSEGEEGGPLELVVNNSKFNLYMNTPGCPPGAAMCRETELPAVGDTEIWEIINISADAHPMHTHLVSFQILARIPFIDDTGAGEGGDGGYVEWTTSYQQQLDDNGRGPGEGPPNEYSMENEDGAIGGNPAVHDFLDTPIAPNAYEEGWKDVVIAYPGEVTRIVVRWAATDEPATGAGAPGVGDNTYPFDPTELIGGVGYVWHCHIIDHEDNEMMRNYVVGTERQPVTPYTP
jgi:FtsP/CotA-like multicopper oxidase with cupredoxin domain